MPQDTQAAVETSAQANNTAADVVVEERAVWSGAYINDLPDSSFAVIESGGKKDEDGKTTPRSLRHLPYKDKDGSLDEAHVRNALSRLPQTKLPANLLARARTKILAAAKELGIDVSDDEKRAIEAAIVLADPDLLAQVQIRAAEQAVAAATAESVSESTSESVNTSEIETRSAHVADNTANSALGVDEDGVTARRVLYAPITRIDREKREVEGIVTSEAVDTFGTIFDYETTKRAFEQAWLGNVREQHDQHRAVGRKVLLTPDDTNKQLWARVRISKGAEDTWQKVLDGTLAGFSLAAMNCKVKERRMIDGRSVPVLAPEAIAELSLVDAPSNPDAAKSGLMIYRSAASDDELAQVAAIFADVDLDLDESVEVTPPVSVSVSVEVDATTSVQTGDEQRDIALADSLVGNDLGVASSASASETVAVAVCCHDGADCGANCTCASTCVCRAAMPDGSTQERAAGPEIVDEPEMPAAPAVAQRVATSSVESAPSASESESESPAPFETMTEMRDAVRAQMRAVQSDGEGGRDGDDGDDDGDDGEGGEEAGASDDAEEESEQDGKSGKTEHRAISEVSEEELTQRASAVEHAESGMENESGHAHSAHSHPHAFSHDVLHMHDHQHAHQDGTAHSHPHMHAHDHHDHSGDADHAHPHSHVHDHSHEYRMAAPDLSRVVESLDTLSTLTSASEVSGATSSTSVVLTTNTTTPVIVETRSAQQLSDDASSSSDESSTTSVETVQTGDDERAGARISSATRAGLHEAALSVMKTCGCEICKDACDLFDPDQDGDDDTTPEGDTDGDYQTRAQRVLMRREVRSILATEVERQLTPYLSRFAAIAARLASASPTSEDVETRAQTGENTQLSDVRSSLGEVLDLVRQIAQAPQVGGPILQAGSTPRAIGGAQQKYLPTDARAVLDGSVRRSMSVATSTGDSSLDVAEAIQVLQQRGILNPGTLSQDTQIDAAAALIQRSFHRGE